MILHLDIDCFFVAAERIKDPSLIGKKVVVIGYGGDTIFGEKAKDGTVVLSASYEARMFGIRSALPVFKAKQLCDDLIFARSDHRFYKELSNKLYNILYSYTPLVERFSIDEFFVDLTGIDTAQNPLEFGKHLQSKIKEKLNLECSIGISDIKFIAKLTTDLVKPFGVGMIRKNEIKEKLKDIPVSKFPGVGKRTLKFLNDHGVFNISDALNAKFIFERLGKNGIWLYENLTGISEQKVKTKEPRKSLTMARTFEEIKDRDELERRLFIMCRYLSFSIYKHGLNPTKFDIKIKYSNKKTVTHGISLDKIFNEHLLNEVSLMLFKKCDICLDLGINYLSVGVGGFKDIKNLKQDLFSETVDFKNLKINSTVQKIREKYGIEFLKIAKEIKNQ